LLTQVAKLTCSARGNLMSPIGNLRASSVAGNVVTASCAAHTSLRPLHHRVLARDRSAAVGHSEWL